VPRDAVREALRTRRSLVERFGARGTLHLLQAAELGGVAGNVGRADLE